MAEPTLLSRLGAGVPDIAGTLAYDVSGHVRLVAPPQKEVALKVPPHHPGSLPLGVGRGVFLVLFRVSVMFVSPPPSRFSFPSRPEVRAQCCPRSED